MSSLAIPSHIQFSHVKTIYHVEYGHANPILPSPVTKSNQASPVKWVNDAVSPGKSVIVATTSMLYSHQSLHSLLASQLTGQPAIQNVNNHQLISQTLKSI